MARRRELVRAVHEQGRHAEALELSDILEAAPLPIDLGIQASRRATRGILLAAHDRLTDALQLVHEAEDLAAKTDSLDLHGDVLVDLADRS